MIIQTFISIMHGPMYNNFSWKKNKKAMIEMLNFT